MDEPDLRETVRFYDICSGQVVRIPASELAPGAVQASVRGIDGLVWILADQLQQGEIRHPPFNQEIRNYLRVIQETLSEHRPLTLDEWEEGFRRDLNPNREIALWLHAADVYRTFTSNEQLKERRRHVYQVIIACMTSSPDLVHQIIPIGNLSSSEVNAVVMSFFGGE